MKEFVFSNDDRSLNVRYKLNVTRHQDNESTMTIHNIVGLDEFEIREAGLPNLEQTINIDDLMSLASDNNIKLEEVSEDGTTVLQAIGTAFAFTTDSPLEGGTENAAYDQDIAAEGGSGNYVFTLDSGDLPAGLTLSEDGNLSGTPTEDGEFTFTVKCTDTFTQEITKEFVLTIAGA